MNKTSTYIYILLDPKNGDVRYVGKSDNPNKRLKEHIKKCRNSVTYKNNWVLSLLNEGKTPLLEVIDDVPYDEWGFWETYYIDLYKSWGFKLTNTAPGGIGGDLGPEVNRKISQSKKGYKHTEESKKKMSEYRIGKKLTEDTKKILSNKLIGNQRSLGTNHSEEFKNKMSKTMSGENNPMYSLGFYKVWVNKFGETKANELLEDLKKKHSNNNKGCGNPFYGKKHDEESIKKMSSRVGKYNPLDGTLIEEYQSITLAAKENNISQPSVSNGCKNEGKVVCGYLWKKIK